MLPFRNLVRHRLTTKGREGLVPGWAVLALCFGLCSWSGGAAQILASLDRTTITLGETVTLTISFDGVGTASAPQLPAIPNFQQLPSTGQRTEMGPGYMRVAFDYQLAPSQAGDFTIPAFQVKAGNQTFSTKPLQVKVLKPGSSVPNPATGAPSAFLKLVAPKAEVYAGEMFPVEIHLYAQEGRFEIPQLAGEGFSFGKMPQHTQTQTIFNNQRYNLIIFKMAALPVRTGPLTLGPATMGLQVSDRGARPDWFGFLPTRKIMLASDPVAIRVLPVPTQNVPPSFSGAVGTFTLRASAAPTSVAVGDPITVKVQIAGSGALEGLNLPSQPDWREFKTYPPESKVSFSDNLGIAGEKSFELVVIPQNHEVKVLPPFSFTFFDPAAKGFRTLNSPAIPLQVRPSSGVAAPLPTLAGVTNQTDLKEKTPAIAPIKVHLGALDPNQSLLLERGWFLALQGLPPILWLGLLARRKYGEALSRNPRLRRQRQAARTIGDGLRQLRQHAAAKKTDEFFATLFRLLQEQIGERLDLPASAITEAVIDERLHPMGMEDSQLAPLHELFQQCNLARYAAGRSSGQLDAIIPQLEKVLENLRKLPDPP